MNILAAFEAAVQRIMRRVDYFALYPSRVVQQLADGTLDLTPEDNRLAPMQAVPVRLGLPGATVKVSAGARVLLGFEAGDPARPVATLWESGTVTELAITAGTVRFNGGDASVARVGDATTSHSHTVVVTGSGTFTTSAAAPTIAAGASGVKA
jgi:hypothetical protein